MFQILCKQWRRHEVTNQSKGYTVTNQIQLVSSKTDHLILPLTTSLFTKSNIPDKQVVCNI